MSNLDHTYPEYKNYLLDMLDLPPEKWEDYIQQKEPDVFEMIEMREWLLKRANLFHDLANFLFGKGSAE